MNIPVNVLTLPSLPLVANDLFSIFIIFNPRRAFPARQSAEPLGV
jgi:hypothetical protein